MSSNQARLFVISAPSGAGKTTLVRQLVLRNPALRFSISYTTRAKRTTETEGRDYFFVNVPRFEQLKSRGELLESAKVFGNFYATSRSQVEAHLAEGHPVILEIDWQGAQQVRESMPECVTVFILPPSRAELERRLRDRKTDSDEVIAGRLGVAMADMSHWTEFDHVIINDELDEAVAALEAVLRGEGDASRSDTADLREKVQKILV